MAERLLEGWTWLSNSPKWHYFRNSRSLCKRFMVLGDPELEQGKDSSPDNCKACVQKLQKEAERAR